MYGLARSTGPAMRNGSVTRSLILVVVAVATALLLLPAVSLADDASLEHVWNSGSPTLERSVGEFDRAGRAGERARTVRQFKRALHRLRRAIPPLDRALGRWRQSVAAEQPSSTTGSRAKEAALAAIDTLRSSFRTLDRAAASRLGDLRARKLRPGPRTLRLLNRAERLLDEADRLADEADALFQQA